VIFSCCNVYGRMYRSVASGIFEGNCPKCGRSSKANLISLLVGLLCIGLLFTSSPVYAADLSSVPADSGKVVPQASVNTRNLRDSLVPLSPEGLKPRPPDSSIVTAEKPKLDSISVGIFAQSGVTFLAFASRNRFEYALDTLFQEYLSQAVAAKDSLLVKKQALQKVNFCFPLFAGLDVMITQNNHVALGAGYIYDREAAIIVDHNSNPHEFFYTLQAVPMFLEWRIGISPRLITLDGIERFSATVRWWWLLSGTEIYSNLGEIRNSPQFQGNGWSVSLGYQILEWKQLRLYGDLGYASLQAKSNHPWTNVVSPSDSLSNPDHAAWGLGGIQLNLRATFGIHKR